MQTPPAILANDQLRLSLSLARGGSITSLQRVSDGTELLWQAPWGELPAGTSRPPSTATVNARENWPGGWRTLFPNSGRNVTLYGTDLGADGEACLAPYDMVDYQPTAHGADTDTSTDSSADSAATVGLTITTRLIRMPVRITRTIELTGATLRVHETAHNEGGQELEVMWAHELCFGAPLLSATSTITTGASVVRPDPDTSPASYDDLMAWPRTQGTSGVINLRKSISADASQTRKAYLSDFTTTSASIRNADLGLGVDLTWDGEQMPYLWYELEAGGQEDFPHFASSYYLGLSPSSSWPRQGIHDARRVASSTSWIAPGEERSTWVELTVV